MLFLFRNRNRNGKKLRLARLLYFAHFASQSLTWPFLPLFLSKRFEAREQGIVIGLATVASCVSGPLLTRTADAVGKRKVFAVSWLGRSSAALTVVTLGGKNKPLLAAAVLCGAVLEAPLIPLVDAAAVAAVSDFGSARVAGSVAWGLGAPLAGFLYDACGFSACVVLSTLLSCVTLACYVALASHRERNAVPSVEMVDLDRAVVVDDDDTEDSSVIPTGSRLVFFGRVLMIGSGFGAVMNWLIVYIEHIGGSASVGGAALAVECLVEVPVMAKTDSFLAFVGSDVVLTLVQLLYALRFLGYALVALAPSPWCVLLVEPLHGVTFALFYPTAVKTAQDLYPKQPAFGQGLFSAIFTAGNGIGALLAGVSVADLGFSTTFVLFALLFLALTAPCLTSSSNINTPRFLPLSSSSSFDADSLHHRGPDDDDALVVVPDDDAKMNNATTDNALHASRYFSDEPAAVVDQESSCSSTTENGLEK